MLEVGMEEDMESRMGVWSEVGFGSGEREVLGKAKEWSRLTKALSRRARIGDGWWLDQVKEQPSKGISRTPR
jgi:hypothetical protein